jgi:hypothetical protein
MARFAADAHFGHGGVISVVGFVIVAAQSRVVTTGAHVIPVHAAAGPMAPFAGLPVFVAIDIEPLIGVRVPGGFGRLKSSAGKANQQLAERIVTDDPCYREGFGFPGEADGRNHGLAIGPGDCGGLSSMVKGFGRNKGWFVDFRLRTAFGESVIRSLPERELLFMAAFTSGGARVFGKNGAFVFERRAVGTWGTRG